MRNIILFLMPTQKQMQIIAQDAHVTLKELKQEFRKIAMFFQLEEKNITPEFFEVTEQKIYELKKTEFQTVIVPKIVLSKTDKQHKYQEKYLRNQINKTYQNQRKIYFNRTKNK